MLMAWTLLSAVFFLLTALQALVGDRLQAEEDGQVAAVLPHLDRGAGTCR